MVSEAKKELLREFVDRVCESCNKPESKVGTLDIHRLKRGYDGGTYTLNNIKVICKKCHKAFHSNEFTHVRAK